MEEALAEEMTRYVGRIAPSPTGALHLGNVRTFMIAWLRARSQGGKVVFRMEDLDHPKDKPGAAVQAVEDLRWLGFDWDEEYVQSERKAFYRDALEFLCASTPARVYPCVCSRRDVEAAQSAPHAGDQLYYPGTCRERFASWEAAVKFLNPEGADVKRVPCWRFRVDPGTCVTFEDAFAGSFAQDVARTLGDFPVARDAGGAGYTLACTVDDLLMGVTEVVRGDDLLAATPAQILLARALTPHLGGVELPTHCHLPLVVGPDGRRLAKRHGDTRVAAYRAEGWSAEKLIGFLAYRSGLIPACEPISLQSLVSTFSLSALPHEPLVITR